MKSLLSFAALAVLVLQAQPSGAQTADSTSGASSNSSSGSSASSTTNAASTSGTSANQQRSRQNATQSTNTPITFNNTTPDRLTTNGTGSYTNNTNNSGFTSSDVTLRTTPTVYAPPVSGGNPCTLAVSGGVSVIGWGAAAGGTFVDADCANRQKIAMIHNAGLPGVAFELMCNDRATYDAVKMAGGKQCAFRQQYEAPGAAQLPTQIAPPVVTPAPAPMAAKEYPRCNPRAGIVDNCRS